MAFEGENCRAGPTGPNGKDIRSFTSHYYDLSCVEWCSFSIQVLVVYWNDLLATFFLKILAEIPELVRSHRCLGLWMFLA
jgi:hypothetical protein